ncbi:MAG: FtsQ-type POTRA domain-containing protein [Treponema sp.]|jgi:cell division protein FtsQ|nr:FtsQ-type POTRA domain-containing protein [Treponema sp.]
MAGDYILPEDVVPAEPTRFEKTLRVFIVVAVLCLGAELVWLLGITPFRPFSRIDLAGYDVVGREAILAQAGITARSSYISTDARAIERALINLSYLESARVFKYFPGRLQIILESRRPVAMALAGIDSKITPVLFDSQGVVFAVGGGENGISYSGMLPVISGFTIDNPFPGMRLPGLFIPIFAELEKIQLSSPELLGAISELRINRKLFDDYDLILFPVHKKIKVRLSELNEDMLRYALLMVDVLTSQEESIDTLDFRSGIASYIPKEAFSE